MRHGPAGLISSVLTPNSQARGSPGIMPVDTQGVAGWPHFGDPPALVVGLIPWPLVTWSSDPLICRSELSSFGAGGGWDRPEAACPPGSRPPPAKPAALTQYRNSSPIAVKAAVK